MTLEGMAQACRGTYRGPEALKNREVTAITTDSRTVDPGCLFVPIVGARADGHDFIPQVMEKGALCTLSERDLGDQNFPYIQVQSSLQAVKDLAEYYLEQLQIPVVGITGSVGKTSTKEMIAAVLAQKYRVLKTQGNFNNELGLPLTVFRLRDEDQLAVLEMGISDFGEMSRLAKVARPNTCVITNIGWCHLENLKDRDGIFKAKTEMFDFLKPGGRVVLNGDDDKLCQVEQVQGKKPLFFGLEGTNDLWADEIQSLGLKGTRCQIHTSEGSFYVKIPMPGRHMVYNALAGTAVGLLYGLNLQEIQAGMKDGMGRRVAILGDMGELGENEAQLHAQVGAHGATVGIDAMICVGPLCRHMAEAAREANPDLPVLSLDSREELLNQLPQLVQEGDTILVKASHFMGFERVVEALEKLAEEV